MMWRRKSLTAFLASPRYYQERKQYKDSECCCPLCLLIASMHVSSFHSSSSSSSLVLPLSSHRTFSSSSSCFANHLFKLTSSSSSSSSLSTTIAQSMSSHERSSKRCISSGSFDSLNVANKHDNSRKTINEDNHTVSHVNPVGRGNSGSIDENVNSNNNNNSKVDVNTANSSSTLIEPPSTEKRNHRRKRLKRKEKNNMAKETGKSFEKEKVINTHYEEMKTSKVEHSSDAIYDKNIESRVNASKMNDNTRQESPNTRNKHSKSNCTMENNASHYEFHGPDVELDQLLRSAERKWEKNKSSQEQEKETLSDRYSRETKPHYPQSNVKQSSHTLKTMPVHLGNVATSSSHATSPSSSLSSSSSASASTVKISNKTEDEITEAVMQEAAALNLNRKMLTMEEMNTHDLSHLTHERDLTNSNNVQLGANKTFTQLEQIERRRRKLSVSESELDVGITERLFKELRRLPALHEVHYGDAVVREVDRNIYFAQCVQSSYLLEESTSPHLLSSQTSSPEDHQELSSTTDIITSKNNHKANNSIDALNPHDTTNTKYQSCSSTESDDNGEGVVELFIDDISDEELSSFNAQHLSVSLSTETHISANEERDSSSYKNHENREQDKKKQEETNINTLLSSSSSSLEEGAVLVHKPLLKSPEPITHTPSFFPSIYRHTGIVQLTPLPHQDCALLLQHLLYLRGQDVKSLSRTLQIKLINSLAHSNSGACSSNSGDNKEDSKHSSSQQLLCLQDVIHYLDHAPAPIIAFTADLHPGENLNQELVTNKEEKESNMKEKHIGKFTSPAFLFTLYVENVSVQNALAHLASLFVIPIKSFHFHTQASKMSSASLICGVEANRLRRVHLLLVNTMRHPGYVIRISNIQEINTQLVAQHAQKIGIVAIDGNSIMKEQTKLNKLTVNGEHNKSEYEISRSQSVKGDLQHDVFSSLAHWQPLYETEMLLRRVECTRREDIELRMNALTELGAIFYCSNREESMCRVATDILHGYYKSALLNALFRPQLPHSLRHFIARPNVITAAKARRVCTDANVTQLLKSFVATNGNYVLTLKRTPFGWRRRWLSALRAKVWNTMASKRIKLGGRMGAIVGDVVVKDEFKEVVHQRMITTLKAEHVKVITSTQDATRYSLEDVFIPFLRGNYPQELFAPHSTEHPIMTENAMRIILTELHALPLLNGLSQIAQYLLDIRSSKSPLLFRRLLIRPIHVEWKLLIDKAPLRSIHYDAARLLENDRWRCEMNVLPHVSLALPSSSTNTKDVCDNNHTTMKDDVQENEKEKSHSLHKEKKQLTRGNSDSLTSKSANALIPQMVLLEKTSLGNCVPVGTLAEEFFKLPQLHDYVVLGQTQRQLPGQFVHASPTTTPSSNSNTTSRGDVVYSLYIKSININGAIGLTQLLREYFILHGVLSESDATLQHKIHRLRREFDVETPLLTSMHYCTVCYNRDHDEQSECAEYLYKREQEQQRRRVAKVIAESAQAARVIQEQQQRPKRLFQTDTPTVSLPIKRLNDADSSRKNTKNITNTARLSTLESSTRLSPSPSSSLQERQINQRPLKALLLISHDNREQQQEQQEEHELVAPSTHHSETASQFITCYMQWDLQRSNEEVAWKIQIDDKLHLYGLQDMTLLVDGKVWITWMTPESDKPAFISLDQLKSLCKHEQEFLAHNTSLNTVPSSTSSTSLEIELEEKCKESLCENAMIRSLTTLFDQIAQSSTQQMWDSNNRNISNNTVIHDQSTPIMSFDGVTAEVLTSLFETKLVKSNSTNDIADDHTTRGKMSNVSCFNAFKLQRCNWVLTEVNGRVINSQADVAAVFLESKHDRQLSLLFSSTIDIHHKPSKVEWNDVKSINSTTITKELEEHHHHHHENEVVENASSVHRLLLPLSLPRLSEAMNVLSVIAKKWINQLPAKLTLTLSRSLLEICTSHASWGIQLHHSDLTLTNLNSFMQLYWLDPLTAERSNVGKKINENSKADRFVKKQSESSAKNAHHVHVTAVQPAELFILPSHYHKGNNHDKDDSSNSITLNDEKEVMVQKIINEASSILNSVYKLHRINGNVVHSVQDVLNYMKGWTQRHEAIIRNNTSHVNRNKNKFAAIQARINLTLERKVNVQLDETRSDNVKLVMHVTYRTNDNECSSAIGNNHESELSKSSTTTTTTEVSELAEPQKASTEEQESHEKSVSTELMVSTKPIKLLTPMQQRTSTFTLVVERRILNKATRYKWGITVEAHSRLLKSVQHDELYYSSVYAADRAKGQRILDNLRYFTAERMRTQIEGSSSNNNNTASKQQQQHNQALPKTPAYSSFRLFAYLIIGVNNKPVHTYRALRAALTQMYVNSTLNTTSSRGEANLSNSQHKELLQASMEQESIVLQVRQVKFMQLALNIKRGEDESGAMRPVGLTLHQKDLYITNVLADSPVAHAIESATHDNCSIRLLIKEKQEEQEKELYKEEEEYQKQANNNKTNTKSSKNNKERSPVIFISSLASALEKLKKVTFPEDDVNSMSSSSETHTTTMRKWKYELDEDEEDEEVDKSDENETKAMSSFVSKYKNTLSTLSELTNNLYKQFMQLSMVDAVQFAQVMRVQEFCDALQQHLSEFESSLTGQTVDYYGNDENLCDDMQSSLIEKWQTEYVQLEKQLREIEENVRWKVVYAIHAKQMLRTSADVALALAPGVMEETIIVQQGFDIYNEHVKTG